MARPSRRQIAQEVADAARELRKEGILDEWGEAFGIRMARNILNRGKPPNDVKRRDSNGQPKVQAAE